MRLLPLFRKLESALRDMVRHRNAKEEQLLLLGRLLSMNLKSIKEISALSEVEFKVFSQCGDDGIIQWLINSIEITEKTFIEFGVADYRESNTRFLLMNNNWSGFVMDGSEANVARIVNAEYFWQYDLTARAEFITSENINSLLSSTGFGEEIGILHIDLDGNDYWIWKEINAVSPLILILEYNSVFGVDRAITIPYDRAFDRTDAHYSNLYFGASLRALHNLSEDKGYAFIGCNSAGNNAYFVRRDQLNTTVRETSLESGYVLSRFRESRNENGDFTCLGGEDRIQAIRGLPVFNTETNEIEDL